MEKFIRSKVTIDNNSRQVDNKYRGIKLVLAKSNAGFEEVRCVNCNRLLFKIQGLHKGEIEVKCGKCGTINVVR